jgi:hypothetical protein
MILKQLPQRATVNSKAVSCLQVSTRELLDMSGIPGLYLLERPRAFSEFFRELAFAPGLAGGGLGL